MTRAIRFSLAFALAAALSAAQKPAPLSEFKPAETPKVARASLAAIEKLFDRTITELDINDPYDLLGTTRGVYLAGYGAVFTAELNLVITPISPFAPQPAGAALGRLHQKKISRLGAVKAAMRQALIGSAAMLDSVPANEQIVFGVTLYYRNWEERAGLPNQIVMRAPRQTLLDYKAGRITSEALDAAIQVEEI